MKDLNNEEQPFQRHHYLSMYRFLVIQQKLSGRPDPLFKWRVPFFWSQMKALSFINNFCSICIYKIFQTKKLRSKTMSKNLQFLQHRFRLYSSSGTIEK